MSATTRKAKLAEVIQRNEELEQRCHHLTRQNAELLQKVDELEKKLKPPSFGVGKTFAEVDWSEPVRVVLRSNPTPPKEDFPGIEPEILEAATKLWKQTMEKRTELLQAFIAETGLLPSQCEQVEEVRVTDKPGVLELAIWRVQCKANLHTRFS